MRGVMALQKQTLGIHKCTLVVQLTHKPLLVPQRGKRKIRSVLCAIVKVKEQYSLLAEETMPAGSNVIHTNNH